MSPALTVCSALSAGRSPQIQHNKMLLLKEYPVNYRPGDHTASNLSVAAAPSPSPCHSNTPHSTHMPAPTLEAQDDPDTESDAPECSEPSRAARQPLPELRRDAGGLFVAFR